MSKQVLDIQQMQHLKELGVDTSKTMMCYRRRTRDFRGEEKVGRWSLVINQPIIVSNFETYEEVPAFTLQDIFDLLPKEINIEVFCHKWYLFVNYQNKSISYSYFDEKCTYCLTDSIFGIIEKNLIDAAYEMLCWCVENGYVDTKK